MKNEQKEHPKNPHTHKKKKIGPLKRRDAIKLTQWPENDKLDPAERGNESVAHANLSRRWNTSSGNTSE